MSYIFEGILLGMTLAILLGPIFVALIQTTLVRGFRAGMVVGSGIWFSDLLTICLIWMFLDKMTGLIEETKFTSSIGWIGALILILVGSFYFFKNTKELTQTRSFTAKSLIGYFSKGFLVNSFNPFTIFYWVSVITTYILVKNVGGRNLYILLATILLTIMITDTLKIFLAKKISKHLSTETLQKITKGTGIILMVFGVVLAIRTYLI